MLSATVPVCKRICVPWPAKLATVPLAGIVNGTVRPPVENWTAGSVPSATRGGKRQDAIQRHRIRAGKLQGHAGLASVALHFRWARRSCKRGAGAERWRIRSMEHWRCSPAESRWTLPIDFGA